MAVASENASPQLSNEKTLVVEGILGDYTIQQEFFFLKRRHFWSLHHHFADKDPSCRRCLGYSLGLFDSDNKVTLDFRVGQIFNQWLLGRQTWRWNPRKKNVTWKSGSAGFCRLQYFTGGPNFPRYKRVEGWIVWFMNLTAPWWRSSWFGRTVVGCLLDIFSSDQIHQL